MRRVYATIWPHRRAKNFERKTEIYGETESGRLLQYEAPIHNNTSIEQLVYVRHGSLCWWLVVASLLVLLAHVAAAVAVAIAVWLCVQRKCIAQYKYIGTFEVSFSPSLFLFTIRWLCLYRVAVNSDCTHHKTSSREHNLIFFWTCGVSYSIWSFDQFACVE